MSRSSTERGSLPRARTHPVIRPSTFPPRRPSSRPVGRAPRPDFAAIPTNTPSRRASCAGRIENRATDSASWSLPCPVVTYPQTCGSQMPRWRALTDSWDRSSRGPPWIARVASVPWATRPQKALRLCLVDSRCDNSAPPCLGSHTSSSAGALGERVGNSLPGRPCSRRARDSSLTRERPGSGLHDRESLHAAHYRSASRPLRLDRPRGAQPLRRTAMAPGHHRLTQSRIVTGSP
jgi:hypothetical protein